MDNTPDNNWADNILRGIPAAVDTAANSAVAHSEDASRGAPVLEDANVADRVAMDDAYEVQGWEPDYGDSDLARVAAADVPAPVSAVDAQAQDADAQALHAGPLVVAPDAVRREESDGSDFFRREDSNPREVRPKLLSPG